MKKRIENLKQMQETAEHFLRKCSATPTKNSATVIALYGDLGSGKTTFVQFIGKILEVSEKVNSPTFVISKNYPLKNQQWKNMIHIDAYRLNGKSDIKNIGLEEQVKNPENIIFIEWPEMIWKKLPKNFLKVELEYISENERKITF